MPVTRSESDPAPGPDAGILSDRSACYRALESHDARFDGRLFVGVQTTGIYCRPICRVRLPKADNCHFFANAPAAEHAGFRPCLKCRPELAPGWSSMDIGAQLARAAIHMIDTSLHEGLGTDEVARRLGVSDRHLRRLFEAHIGVSPVQYLQTQRLLLAKRLLTDTSMKVIDVALAAGFGSVRRLNASLKQRYQLTPTQLRGQLSSFRSLNQRDAGQGALGAISLSLSVRQPYDFDAILNFLAARTLDGVEQVGDGRYIRLLTVNLPGDESGQITGWVQIQSGEGDTLVVTISPELTGAVAPVLSCVRRLFDLDSDPADFLPVLGELAAKRPGLRVPGAVSGFEIAVRAVLGQQVSVKAARTLTSRFVQRFGRRYRAAPDDPLGAQLTHAFPEPARIARVSASRIAELGIIGRRAQTIKALARAIGRGELDLSPAAPIDSTIAALTGIAGIGDWTAQYIAMRAMRWPDAFIAADYGVMKALGVTTAAQSRAAVDQWRPWRSYAVIHLWHSLGDNDD